MTRTFLVFSAFLFSVLVVACGDTNNEEETSETTTSTDMSVPAAGSESYVSLRTGQAVVYDAASGRYIDNAGNTVDFYVDVNTHDTFYGADKIKVNDAIIYENSDWRLDDTKIKIDGDEMKIKDGDSKTKIEGDEYKSKSGDTKVKSEDGETKVKIK